MGIFSSGHRTPTGDYSGPREKQNVGVANHPTKQPLSLTETGGDVLVANGRHVGSDQSQPLCLAILAASVRLFAPSFAMDSEI